MIEDTRTRERPPTGTRSPALTTEEIATNTPEDPAGIDHPTLRSTTPLPTDTPLEDILDNAEDTGTRPVANTTPATGSHLTIGTSTDRRCAMAERIVTILGTQENRPTAAPAVDTDSPGT